MTEPAQSGPEEVERGIEATLFAAEEPMSVDQLAAHLGDCEKSLVRDALKALQAHYSQRGVQLVERGKRWHFETAAAGHGRSTCDTHKQMPVVDASEKELETDIAPFRTLNQALIGMTGHLKFPVWDEDNPATLSSTIISDIIRGKIGFDGLLLSDDIDMEALTGSIPERSAKAQAAGCDIVLNCWAKVDDMTGICEALAPMSDATAKRLDRALEPTWVAQSMPDEQRELLAKRDALLALAEVAA